MKRQHHRKGCIPHVHTLAFPTAAGVADDGPTVSELVKAYLKDLATLVKPQTYEQRRYISLLFSEEFGTRRAMQIKPSDVRGWIFGNPRWRTQATRWTAGYVIRRVFNWAVGDRRIPHNPIEGLGISHGQPRAATTEDEFQIALRHCKSVRFRRLLVFLRACGCRPGEARALRWEWVDLARSIAVFPPEYHKTGHQTGKPKILPLPTTARKLLALMLREQAQPDGSPPSGLCFTNHCGNPWTPAATWHQVNRIRIHCGRSLPAFLYGLRHAFGTSGIAKGAPIKLVSQAMGHARVEMTERHYCHLDREVAAIVQAAEIAAKRQPPAPLAKQIPSAPLKPLPPPQAPPVPVVEPDQPTSMLPERSAGPRPLVPRPHVGGA